MADGVVSAARPSGCSAGGCRVVCTSAQPTPTPPPMPVEVHEVCPGPHAHCCHLSRGPACWVTPGSLGVAGTLNTAQRCSVFSGGGVAALGAAGGRGARAVLGAQIGCAPLGPLKPPGALVSCRDRSEGAAPRVGRASLGPEEIHLPRPASGAPAPTLRPLPCASRQVSVSSSGCPGWCPGWDVPPGALICPEGFSPLRFDRTRVLRLSELGALPRGTAAPLGGPGAPTGGPARPPSPLKLHVAKPPSPPRMGRSVRRRRGTESYRHALGVSLW